MKKWKSCLAAALALAAATAFSSEPLLLQWGTIDTSGTEAQAESAALKAKVAKKAALARARKSADKERAAYIVQFPGPVTEEWRTWLESATQVRGYLPEFAYLVWATATEMETIAANPSVFWTGEWKKEYKTVFANSVLVSPAPKGSSASPRARWMHVGSLKPGDDGAADFRARLEALPSDVRSAFPRLDGSSAVAWLTDAQIDEVAAWPDVEWIEPQPEPVLFNDKAVLTNMMNVTPAWKAISAGGLGLTGTNQIVAVSDTGLDTGNLSDLHADFEGRVTAYAWTNGAYNTSASWKDIGGHGTHVCGSILSSGAKSSGQYKGIAYEASLIIQGCWTNLSGLPDYTPDLFMQAYTNGARIHSDSWSYGTNYSGVYATNFVKDGITYVFYPPMYVDGYMWTNQNFLAVFAAGNYGADANKDGVIDPGSVTAPGTAKNSLCVGAAENYRSDIANTWGASYGSPIKEDKRAQTSTPQGLAAFSGRGPTLDGRFKPDIVAPGTYVISTRSRATTNTGWGVVSANTNYLFMGGTSMATPLTSGALALVRQWLVDRKGINEPMAALMKALLINGARDMTPGQYDTGATQEITARPDRSQGFGHVNLYNSLEPGSGNFLVFATNRITGTGATFTTNIAVGQPNAGTYVLTLAWQDCPGSPGAAKPLVNDLDLTVTAPSGTVIYPNNLATNDRINNVEFIEFSATETGDYAVEVRGGNITRTNPNGGQPFALVMRGPETSPLEECPPEFSSDTSSTNGEQYEDIEFEFSPLLTQGYPFPVYHLTSNVPEDDYDFDPTSGYLYYTPQSYGTFSFQCVASNGLGTATNTLEVTVTRARPAVPSGLAVSGIDSTSFTVSWNAVTNTDAYILDIATLSGSSTPTLVLSEDFTGFSSTSYSSTMSTQTVNGLAWTYVNAIFNPSAPAKAPGTTGSVQLRKADGYLHLPPVDNPTSLSLNASGSSSGSMVLEQLVSGSWTTLSSMSVSTNCSAYSYSFANAGPATALRLHSPDRALTIHDITVTAPTVSAASIPGYPRDVGTATSVYVTDLCPSTAYTVSVCASNTAGASDWAPAVTAVTDSADYPPGWLDTFPSSTVYVDVASTYELDIAACADGHPAPDILLDLDYTDAAPGEYSFADGILRFTPSRTGYYDFRFVASNALGTANATLRFRGEASSPRLSFSIDTDEIPSIAVGESVEFTVSASGVPAPVLSVACTNAVEDEEYLFFPESGSFYFEPTNAGTYRFAFAATNIVGWDTETVEITVVPERITIPVLSVTDIAATSATAVWTSCTGVGTYLLQLATNDQFTISSGTIAATNLFYNPAGSATAPDGWTYDIDSASSGYPILRHGHSIVSEAVDTTGCSSLVLSFSLRTYGGTNYPLLSVKYSTDDGTTWLDAGSTNATKGTTWIYPTMTLPAATVGHPSLRLRFASTTPSGSTHGVGITAITLTANIPSSGSLLLETFVEGTAWTFTNLLPATTYYSRVQASTNWSDIVSFTTASSTPVSGYEQWLATNGYPSVSGDITAANDHTYWENYIADIDPTGSNWLEIVPDPSTGSTFTIPAASGNRYYQFIYSTNLSSGFRTNNLGTGTTNPIAAPGSNDWYGSIRVLLEAPADP